MRRIRIPDNTERYRNRPPLLRIVMQRMHVETDNTGAKSEAMESHPWIKDTRLRSRKEHCSR